MGGGAKTFPDQQRSTYKLALDPLANPPPPGPSLPPGDVLMPLLIRADPPDVQGVTQRKLWGGGFPQLTQKLFSPPLLLKSWKLFHNAQEKSWEGQLEFLVRIPPISGKCVARL